MLTPWLEELDAKKIVLGSKSPRRQSILAENVGITNFEVEKSTFEEDIDKSGLTPEQYVRMTCEGKLNELKGRLKDFDLLICADTVVCHDGKIFEKPADKEAAVAMLRVLSGTTHQVLTAVSIFIDDKKSVSFVEKTTVRFADLGDKAIEGYVMTGEPYDKAGGYGIQSLAASFCTGIDGDPFNVYGFPVQRFCAELIELMNLS